MRFGGQRMAMMCGLALVAFSSVGLSVVLTRLYSAALGHHLAFFAVSLALFGIGLGGGIVAIIPRIAQPPHLFRNLALASGLASMTSIVTIIKTLVTKAPLTLDSKGIGVVATLYALSAIPFTCMGIVVAAALRNARGAAARLYFADMLGAAAGGAGVLVLLRLGAPRGGLAICVVLGVASAVFAAGSMERRGAFSDREVRGGGWAAGAILASGIALFCGDYGEQWLTVKQLRYVNLERAQFIAWNELALVTVDKPIGGVATMRVDASAASTILAAKTAVPKHPMEMGYAVSGASGPTLVIGAGGGREVRAALAAGQTEITAVEINRTVANDVMLGKMREFSGGLYDKPEVRLVVDDGRSFLRSDDRKYKYIVLSPVDTWAAASVGGMALTEDNLYTLEAFRGLVDHLTPDGLLVVNRRDAEFERLLSLSAAAVLAEGGEKPQAHMFACSYKETTTLLIAREELTEQAREEVRGHCSTQGFREVFAPDWASDDGLANIAQDPWGVSHATKGRDISPPTDERPFFFYTVPPRELFATITNRKKLETEQHGLLTAVLVILVSAAASLLFFVVPAVLRPRELVLAKGRGGRIRVLAFFAAIGGGFSLVEIGLAQILTAFLGHPVYALTAVLAALLLGVGIGSFLVRHVPARVANLVAARRAQILTMALVACALALMPITSTLVGIPLVARVGLTLGLSGVLGLLMGAFMPLAISIAASRSSNLVAWGFALNGFFGVTATGIATLAAMHVGYSFVFILGAVAYFVASAVVPPAAPRPS